MAWDLSRFIWPLAVIATRLSIRVANIAGFGYKRSLEIITWGMSTVRVIVHPRRGRWRSHYRCPMSGEVTDGLTGPFKCIMYCIRDNPSTCWFRARIFRWIMQRSYHPSLARSRLKILDAASSAPLAWLRFDTFDSMSFDSRERCSTSVSRAFRACLTNKLSAASVAVSALNWYVSESAATWSEPNAN
jgi:hypothetical protein